MNTRYIRIMFIALTCWILAGRLAAQVVTTPFITTQPQSQTVVIGGSVTFSVVAGGSAPLSYQWRKGNGDIVGRTGTSLTLTNVQPGDAANYSVVVLNSSGSVVSSPATLTVTVPGVPPTVSTPPGQTVGIGDNVTLNVNVSGDSPFNYQWRKNGATIPGANGANLILPSVTAVDAANYTVVVSNAFGTATSDPMLLTVLTPPSISAITQTPSGAVAPGTNVSFTVVAAGSAPLRYQWSKDNRPIIGATNVTLSLNAVSAADGGTYSVSVANNVRAVSSSVQLVIGVGASSKIINVSVRTAAGVESETLIVGFVVAGSGDKPVLVRGIGPSLAAFSVTGFVTDPVLSLYRDTVRLATNDNWGDSLNIDPLSEAIRLSGAFPIGVRSLDSALLSVLQAGSYSAQLTGRAGTGIGLVELYDTNTALPARLTNVSARATVGRGTNVLIAGFVIDGNTPKTVLVRAIGPTLAAFGVTGVLNDPQLVLNRGNVVVASNDDWWRGTGQATLEPVFRSAGAFALVTGTRDSALVATLQPGAYTATVSGTDDGTGVALVEVYEVP